MFRFQAEINLTLALTIALAVTSCGESIDTIDSPHEDSQPPKIVATPHQPSLPATLPEIVTAVAPSVVSINVETLSTGFFYDFTNEGTGTGIIIRPDGYVVTNNHVVQGARIIKVSLANGKSYDGTIIGFDRLTDLSVIKINADNLPTVKFGSSQTLEPGDWVLTIGNAFALAGGPSVTAGIVSGLGRTISTDMGDLYDMIQTDAAINSGNSGGPLVNMKGEVVGINTAMYRQAQGMGFAVSASVAEPVIQSLMKNGKVSRPLIGISAINVTPRLHSAMGLHISEGVLITRLQRTGPAFKSGMKVGMIITALDGIPVKDMPTFLTLLWTYSSGDKVKVTLLDQDKIIEIIVQLAERA